MLCFRLLSESEPAAPLASLVVELHNGHAPKNMYALEPNAFKQIPNAPFAYWVSEDVRGLYQRHELIETDNRFARVGDHPGDSFRYIRLDWEFEWQRDSTWVTYQKGGAFSKYYADLHLRIDWDEINCTYRGFLGRKGRSSISPSNYEFFFRPGLSWPMRTNGLSFRALQSNAAFSHKGPCLFVSKDDHSSLLYVLGIVNSQPFSALLSLQLARVHLAQSYEVGLVQVTPIPKLVSGEIGEMAKKAWSTKRSTDTATLTSHAFHAPALAPGRKPTAR